MFTFPPPHPLPAHSEAHSHRLPWAGRSPAQFGWGGSCREHWRKRGGGEERRAELNWRLLGTHRGGEPSPRGWQTSRLCRPPASDVTSASPCVSADCRGITSREITARCHSNISWDLGVPSPGNQRVVPGDGGVPAALSAGGRGSSQPLDRWMLAFIPMNSRDLCHFTALTVT